jgi:hypothetical protein
VISCSVTEALLVPVKYHWTSAWLHRGKYSSQSLAFSHLEPCKQWVPPVCVHYVMLPQPLLPLYIRLVTSTFSTNHIVTAVFMDLHQSMVRDGVTKRSVCS